VTVGQRKLLDEHVQGLVHKGAFTLQSLLAELRRLGDYGGKLGNW
jgi:hypothetical protein